MAEDVTLTQEEQDSVLPPPDAAKYQAWYEHQLEVSLREADEPNAELVPHEEVVRQLREKQKEWRARAAQQRNVA